MKNWYLYTTGETETLYYWTFENRDGETYKVRTVEKARGEVKTVYLANHADWVKHMDTIIDPRYQTKDDIIFNLTSELNHIRGFMDYNKKH